MAPVESFIQTKESDKKPLDLIKPGQEVTDNTFPQARIIVTCDGLDFNGTVEVQTPKPETIRMQLFESISDKSPKPLEAGGKHSFSGQQRVEIRSELHDEIISLEHRVAAGVALNTINDLLSKRARFQAQPVANPKPALAVTASR